MLNADEKQWVNDTLQRVESKMRRVSKRSAHKIPYTTVNGIHDDRTEEIEWWTNGFWGGMMWQLYTLTGDEAYKAIAEENEQKLDAKFRSYDGLDHDNGFVWLPTAVADYRVTGNPQSRNRGLLAADILAGRYNTKGRFIRAWNTDLTQGDRRGWAIIDCMMNLPLLYWASEELKDPRFEQIASAHAQRAAECFVRGDGSVNHIVEFDIGTGEMARTYGGQGYGIGSSWSRGQSWAIYGFVLSYLHTKNVRFLETAERVANYFIANIPQSGLIPVDFRQPEEVCWEDSTAAAIAACGLIELAKLREGRQRRIYLNAALRMLKVLAEERCNWNEAEDDLLLKCSARYHEEEHEYSIIYGDYYFIEALMKLAEKELFIW